MSKELRELECKIKEAKEGLKNQNRHLDRLRNQLKKKQEEQRPPVEEFNIGDVVPLQAYVTMKRGTQDHQCIYTVKIFGTTIGLTGEDIAKSRLHTNTSVPVVPECEKHKKVVDISAEELKIAARFIVGHIAGRNATHEKRRQVEHLLRTFVRVHTYTKEFRKMKSSSFRGRVAFGECADPAFMELYRRTMTKVVKKEDTSTTEASVGFPYYNINSSSYDLPE